MGTSIHHNYSRCSLTVATLLLSLLAFDGSISPAHADPSTATSSQEISVPEPEKRYDSVARLDRQHIVSELDRKADIAKRDYGIEANLVPALRACAPLDASVETCRAEADRVSADIDAAISHVIQERASQPTPLSSPSYNVTIIDQSETWIIDKESRPRPPYGRPPGGRHPEQHKRDPHGPRTDNSSAASSAIASSSQSQSTSVRSVTGGWKPFPRTQITREE